MPVVQYLQAIENIDNPAMRITAAAAPSIDKADQMEVKADYSSVKADLFTVKADESTLKTIFKDSKTSRYLFPSGILIRDSQPFSVGNQYLSNIHLLLSDRLTAMYVTHPYSDINSGFKALSFGTGVDCGVTLNMMRYCIDYYGNPCIVDIKHHVTKHLQELSHLVINSPIAKTLTCQFYAHETVLTESMREELFNFMASMISDVYVNRKREYRQCVVDVLDDPRRLATVQHKL